MGIVIDRLYKNTCNTCIEEPFIMKGNISLSDKLLKSIFNGKKPKDQLDLELYQTISKNLSEPIDKQFGLSFGYDEPDNVMRAMLKTNVFKFSGAKSLSMMLELRSQLVDGDNKPRSFSDFKIEALKVNDKYNVNWLRAEHQQAIAQSQNASNWLGYEKDQDTYPNLRYETIGDDRVRDEHAVLNGIVKPVKDAFWNTYAPQNGWGCRCELIQENEDIELTEDEDAIARGKRAKLAKPFKTNVGKTFSALPEKHPYYQNISGIVDRKHQLGAVKHYGMKTVKSIYDRPTKLSKYAKELETKEEYDNWWTKNVKKYGVGIMDDFVYQSKATGQKILFDNKFYKKRKTVDEKRYKYAPEVLTILDNPDEIFSLFKGKTGTESDVITTYIKYYENEPIVVITNSYRIKSEIKILSFYKVNDFLKGGAMENFRRGILEYKK